MIVASAAASALNDRVILYVRAASMALLVYVQQQQVQAAVWEVDALIYAHNAWCGPTFE